MDVTNSVYITQFQHTAARRRLICVFNILHVTSVSTHSRPKAAEKLLVSDVKRGKFQHTAARRRLSKFSDGARA